jgi:site-specific DNA recombinase
VESEVVEALGRFDAIWDSLTPREQVRVVELLIERVTFDGPGENVSITFRPTGIKTLLPATSEGMS